MLLSTSQTLDRVLVPSPANIDWCCAARPLLSEPLFRYVDVREVAALAFVVDAGLERSDNLGDKVRGGAPHVDPPLQS